MKQIFAVGTHGTDDPTRAALPFITAIGAIGAEKPVVIGLLAEAAILAKKEIANGILPVGFPPLAELIEKVKGKATVFV